MVDPTPPAPESPVSPTPPRSVRLNDELTLVLLADGEEIPLADVPPCLCLLLDAGPHRIFIARLQRGTHRVVVLRGGDALATPPPITAPAAYVDWHEGMEPDAAPAPATGANAWDRALAWERLTPSEALSICSVIADELEAAMLPALARRLRNARVTFERLATDLAAARTRAERAEAELADARGLLANALRAEAETATARAQDAEYQRDRARAESYTLRQRLAHTETALKVALREAAIMRIAEEWATASGLTWATPYGNAAGLWWGLLKRTREPSTEADRVARAVLDALNEAGR